MNQPLWKIWFSYFKEIILETSSSQYNPNLVVSLSKGQYQLSTAEAIYSYGLRYDNYFKAFNRLNLDILGESMLLLGLGLGSIPLMLEKVYKKSFMYTAVEIDEEVIYLASKYVLKDLQSNLQIINADAYYYSMCSIARFDVIALDVFESNKIPDKFETFEFLQCIKDLLSSDGLLLLNRLYYYEDDKQLSDEYFTTVFKKVFPEATFIEVSGNKILVSNNNFLKTNSTIFL